MATGTSAHAHHALDYVELSAFDLEAAKRFYGAAFGWTFTDYGPDYVGFVDGAKESGRKEAGGFRRDEQVASGGPLVILYSERLEETLDRVRDAGGHITAEIFTFPGGRRFQFADPSGNQLAVWSDR